jgi:hypothetical protein
VWQESGQAVLSADFPQVPLAGCQQLLRIESPAGSMVRRNHPVRLKDIPWLYLEMVLFSMDLIR